MRIKCCGIIKSEGNLFVRNKLNLIIDLFWKIGFRHRIGSCRYVSRSMMYVSTALHQLQQSD